MWADVDGAAVCAWRGCSGLSQAVASKKLNLNTDTTTDRHLMRQASRRVAAGKTPHATGAIIFHFAQGCKKQNTRVRAEGLPPNPGDASRIIILSGS
jgi:hypothetical protein